MTATFSKKHHDDPHTSNPVAVPVQIFMHLAEHITSRQTLKSLSLASCICRDAAQSQIFRHISFEIRTWTTPFKELLDFFVAHPNLVGHVRSLTLCGQRTSKIPVDLHSIAEVVELLPGLLELTLASVSWIFPVVSTPAVETTFHPSLRHLSLKMISLTSDAYSPLSLLALRPSWDTVHIGFIDHPATSTFRTDHRTPINVLDIQHIDLPSNVRTLPTPIDSFCDVVAMSVQNTLQTNVVQVGRIISASTATLQSLKLKINCIGKGTLVIDCIWFPIVYQSASSR